MGGCAGLVKADGWAEPTCKIHFLSIRSLDESVNLCVKKWTESVLKSKKRKFKSPGSGGCAALGRSSRSLPLSKCLPRAPALLVLPLPWTCSPWDGDSSSAMRLLKEQENWWTWKRMLRWPGSTQHVSADTWRIPTLLSHRRQLLGEDAEYKTGQSVLQKGLVPLWGKLALSFPDPLWLQGYPCFSMKLMGRPRRCVRCPAGPRSARPQQSRQSRVWAQQALDGWLTEEQMKCSKWQCKNLNKSLTMSCFKSALSAGFFIKLKGRKTGWAVACCWF